VVNGIFENENTLRFDFRFIDRTYGVRLTASFLTKELRANKHLKRMTILLELINDHYKHTIDPLLKLHRFYLD
jgi:hypothetical protein